MHRHGRWRRNGALGHLRLLERKACSALPDWMLQNANHIRPSRDGLKVHRHRARCVFCILIMAALGREVLRRCIDHGPNSVCAALTFLGGTGWRNARLADLCLLPRVQAIICQVVVTSWQRW